MAAWLRRARDLLMVLAASGGLGYASALYLRNLGAWPFNASVREWWGSELAIRYCHAFVRRGLLGQIAWQIGSWFGNPSAYTLALSLLMALCAMAVGLCLGRLLVHRCGWRLGLLILAAPAGWPVLLESAGSTFRKDGLQILLGLLLLWIWRRWVRGRPPRQAPAAWLLLAGVQILAVLIHEPFTLLILPALAIAAFWSARSVSVALQAVAPGLLAFGAVLLHRGSAADVACLSRDLQRLGLLAPGEAPGSSIRELGLALPAHFTLSLAADQLAWSLVHGLLMTLVVVLAYALLLDAREPARSGPLPLKRALRLWLIQLLGALPVFLTAVDYGRWFAMLFCSGLGLLLIAGPSPSPAAPVCQPADRSGRSLATVALALPVLTLLPSGCCTYQLSQIVALIPYAAASQWKALLLNRLAFL